MFDPKIIDVVVDNYTTLLEQIETLSSTSSEPQVLRALALARTNLEQSALWLREADNIAQVYGGNGKVDLD